LSKESVVDWFEIISENYMVDGGRPKKILDLQDYLEIPVAVENVSSYAEYHDSQVTEWEFLNEVIEAADCGILLDLNNISVSSRNHDLDPMVCVNSISADREVQIHIGSHSKFEKYTFEAISSLGSNPRDRKPAQNRARGSPSHFPRYAFPISVSLPELRGTGFSCNLQSLDVSHWRVARK
jgi:hypothetical protein